MTSYQCKLIGPIENKIIFEQDPLPRARSKIDYPIVIVDPTAAYPVVAPVTCSSTQPMRPYTSDHALSVICRRQLLNTPGASSVLVPHRLTPARHFTFSH
jgi:hypothetical protein